MSEGLKRSDTGLRCGKNFALTKQGVLLIMSENIVFSALLLERARQCLSFA